ERPDPPLQTTGRDLSQLHFMPAAASSETSVVTCRPKTLGCAVPECRGISHADATFREALWDRFFTAAPRPRTPSELLYSDRRLRSKSSPDATILIRKR